MGQDANRHTSKFLGRLETRLNELRGRLVLEPQSNPVRSLAFEISRDLESGKITQTDLANMARRLSDDAFQLRAKRLGAYLGDTDITKNGADLDRLIDDEKIANFAAFAKRWERPRLNLIFTAHPTFLLSNALRSKLVSMVDTGQPDANIEDIQHSPDKNITLSYEHKAVLDAIENAKTAIRFLTRKIIDHSRIHFPKEWRSIRPRPVGTGTWVGYDLDGRTDIHWSDALRFRLFEKRKQLESYDRTVRKLMVIAGDDPAAPCLNEIGEYLASTLVRTDKEFEAFQGSLETPEAISAAANILSQNGPGKLVTIKPLLKLTETAIEATHDDDLAAALILLHSEMREFSLGVASVHFRLNKTQLHNAMRRTLNIDEGVEVFSRSLLAEIGALIREAKANSVNFASLDIETTTAIRQFILMAQIVKHIDADADIRLLIAECEQPVTVLAAIYFARLFGVSDCIDICPLFETNLAMERAGHILEALLAVDEYRETVRTRGRLSVQTGFSDAGRFIGQIPATLAIERLHGQLARAAANAGLVSVDIVIFDTHGESMGRGAHPQSIQDRVLYTLSPWVRRRFQEYNLPLVHELSFQGGDGYILFGSEGLAIATLAGILAAEIKGTEIGKDDPFYTDTDFTFDFFRSAKRYQEELLKKPEYHIALSALGLSLLPETGSRKSRRQFEGKGDQRTAIRKLRAIPHNAIMQQLNYPINIIAGIGSAVQGDKERFVELYERSDRLRRLIALVTIARQRSNLKNFVAYASLYDSTFWVTRPFGNAEPERRNACLYLGRLLKSDERFTAISSLATELRIDVLHLGSLLEQTGLADASKRKPESTGLDILQALRLALVQYIFLLAARVPRFSTRSDMMREDIMELVFGLHIPEAAAQLHNAYPTETPRMSDFSLIEEADYPGDNAPLYEGIKSELIDPMLDAYETILKISVGIAHHFGAQG